MPHPELLQKYSGGFTGKNYGRLNRALKQLIYLIFKSNIKLNTSIDSAIEDFLQEFVLIHIKSKAAPTDQSELTAWLYQCAVNKVQVNGKKRKIIELRAFSFLQKLNKEASTVLLKDFGNLAILNNSVEESSIIEAFENFLQGNVRQDLVEESVQYLRLKLKGFKDSEIKSVMGITMKRCDHIQQRLTYHYQKFKTFL